METQTEPNNHTNNRVQARLALDHLTIDARLQSRGLKPAVVKEYADALKRGEALPPVVVVLDGKGHYYLVDGHHRVAARRELAGMDDVEVQVVEGTFTDALWLSWGANHDHGLRRTREDKQRAVRAALQHPKWSRQSDRAIARHIGCFHQTVGAMRRRLASGESSTDLTVLPSYPSPYPSKEAILRACELLAKTQPEQTLRFSPAELAVVRAGYEPLHRLLHGASTLKPKHAKRAEQQSEGINHVIN